jgi:hypothetical protein
MIGGYGQKCPVARSLDVIGEKWTLLILRDLMRKGPLRFQSLETGRRVWLPTHCRPGSKRSRPRA